MWTMADVGYTATVTYPAVRVLSEEKLSKLTQLLRNSNTHVVARLCYDLLKTKDYIAYDGGEASKALISTNPVHMHGAKGAFPIPQKFKQGAEYAEQALAAYSGETLLQFSIVSTLELYLVYTTRDMSECVGVIRTPFAGLRDLGGQCRNEQGFASFSN